MTKARMGPPAAWKPRSEPLRFGHHFDTGCLLVVTPIDHDQSSSRNRIGTFVLHPADLLQWRKLPADLCDREPEQLALRLTAKVIPHFLPDLVNNSIEIWLERKTVAGPYLVFGVCARGLSFTFSTSNTFDRISHRVPV